MVEVSLTFESTPFEAKTLAILDSSNHDTFYFRWVSSAACHHHHDWRLFSVRHTQCIPNYFNSDVFISRTVLMHASFLELKLARTTNHFQLFTLPSGRMSPERPIISLKPYQLRLGSLPLGCTASHFTG